MRWLHLVLLAGCRQALGLEPPTRAPPVDAPIDTSVPMDAPLLVGCDANDGRLVACFDFEGDATNHSGTMLGVASTVTGFVPGVLGQAVQLEQLDSIRINETVALDVAQVTLEAWIQIPQLPGISARMGVIDNDSQYGLFVLGSGELYCTAGGALTAGTVAVGRWVHLACTFDGATETSYIDGSAVGALAMATPLSTTGTSGSAIGGNSPSGDPLIGDMDVVRIYDVARSAAQICSDAGRAACP